MSEGALGHAPSGTYEGMYCWANIINVCGKTLECYRNPHITIMLLVAKISKYVRTYVRMFGSICSDELLSVGCGVLD